MTITHEERRKIAFMKNIFKKTFQKIFYNRFYFKILSKFTKLNAETKNYKFNDFKVNYQTYDLEFKQPEFREMNPTYVFIRNLKFHPEVKFQLLKAFDNLIKLKNLDLNFVMILRDYPLKFFTNLKQIPKERIFLKIKKTINSFSEKQINIAKKIKVTEEIIQILPYTKKVKKQKLFKLPIERSPVYKSYFPESEMKRFREDLARQNQTERFNVEITEIYDKFSMKLFSDVKQTSRSKNLLCFPSFSNSDIKINNDLYYLIIGKRRDTNELVKALSDPAVIQDDSKY